MLREDGGIFFNILFFFTFHYYSLLCCSGLYPKAVCHRADDGKVTSLVVLCSVPHSAVRHKGEEERRTMTASLGVLDLGPAQRWH